LLSLFVAIIAITQTHAEAANVAPLRLVQIIPLPGAKGKFDHLAIDLGGSYLYRRQNQQHAPQVVRPKKGRRVRSASGFHEPQGVLYLRDAKRASTPTFIIFNSV